MNMCPTCWVEICVRYKHISHISIERTLLQSILLSSTKDEKVNEYLSRLIEINSELWKVEDDIRDCERIKRFDQKFVDLARSVYINNDKRSEIKLEINNYFDSTLVEVKSYEKY